MCKKAMYKVILCTSLFFLASGGFSQSISSLAIFSFDISGSDLSAEDAVHIRNRCIEEITSWGVLSVFDERNALNADYTARGKISQDEDGFTLSAETIVRRTEKSAASSVEQASSLEELQEKIFDFCIKITQPIPFPNYLVGTWEASIPVEGSPLLCRLEFTPNRTVIVERYDTYEYQIGSVLKYEGYGRGTYTYFSRIRRGRLSGAAMNISLTLTDALPDFVSVSGNRIAIDFDEGRASFRLLGSALPCGENNGGPSVYPEKNMAYIRFVKK